MTLRFKPRQLDAFVAVAELANFTLAARRLHLTPSAVSGLVAELERALGFPLFERTTRKVSLTSGGRKFLPSALAVQRQLGRAASAAADIALSSVDVVRVAAPMVIASVLLPPLIAGHRGERPKTVVRILDTAVEWLVDRVQSGEADLALGPDREVPAEIGRVALFPSAWVLWCAPDHSLARSREPVRWRDLQAVDVYAAGHDHEHSIRPLLPPGSEAAEVQPVQVVDNISTALGLAGAGLGVTFSPDYVGPLAASWGLVSRTLIEPEIVRQVSLYDPRDRELSAAAQAFRDFLTECGGGRPK